jgi:hypothetical protein
MATPKEKLRRLLGIDGEKRPAGSTGSSRRIDFSGEPSANTTMGRMSRDSGGKNLLDTIKENKPKATPSSTPVKDAMAQVSKRREAPVMGSMKNVDVGMGRGTVTPPPAKAAPKINTSKSTTKTGPKFKTEKVDISTGGEYDTRGAGMAGTPGGAAAERMGRTTTFGSDDSDDSGAASGTTMRKGLFGEDISAEDYDAMTRRNKESTPFYGQFLKKGGKVKAYKSGGSVKASSASKRGDGCAQRGKTRGKIV